MIRALLALVLAGLFALAACDTDCSESDSSSECAKCCCVQSLQSCGYSWDDNRDPQCKCL